MSNKTELNRVIRLPMLIFYGVGVTVGAGIFALSGEVIAISGNLAPWSFFLAAVIAGLTAVSYSVLSSNAPRAAGEAWYVQQAFGQLAGVLVGLLLTTSAVLSSAAISVAFANYLSELVSVPSSVLIVLVLLTVAWVSWRGIRETVIFAALITSIEVGALIVVISVGLPQVVQGEVLEKTFDIGSGGAEYTAIAAGAVLAFFAFIGFEDIVNMGEEATNAKQNLPIAIVSTLLITLVVYVLVSIVCVAVADRAGLLNSDAPLSFVFEEYTGLDPWAISLCAAIAMVNGILVQVVMSSRVLYGLSRSGSLPAIFGEVGEKNRTPTFSIVLVSMLVLILALSFDLANLAIFSSVALLMVFCAVNASLCWRGWRRDDALFRRWFVWGILSLSACASLLLWQLWSSLVGLVH